MKPLRGGVGGEKPNPLPSVRSPGAPAPRPGAPPAPPSRSGPAAGLREPLASPTGERRSPASPRDPPGAVCRSPSGPMQPERSRRSQPPPSAGSSRSAPPGPNPAHLVLQTAGWFGGVLTPGQQELFTRRVMRGACWAGLGAMLGALGTGLAAGGGAELRPRYPAPFGSRRLCQLPTGAGASHGAAFQPFKERLTRFGTRRARQEPRGGVAGGGCWAGEAEPGQRGEQQSPPRAPDTARLPGLAPEPLLEVGCERRIRGGGAERRQSLSSGRGRTQRITRARSSRCPGLSAPGSAPKQPRELGCSPGLCLPVSHLRTAAGVGVSPKAPFSLRRAPLGAGEGTGLAACLVHGGAVTVENRAAGAGKRVFRGIMVPNRWCG